MELDDLEYVEGCSVLLSPDGTVDGYVLGFGFPPSSAEGNFGGSHQILSYVGKEIVGNRTVYIHSNEDYEVTTTLVEEQQLDHELMAVSGTVVVRGLGTDRSLTVLVTGERGC